MIKMRQIKNQINYKEKLKNKGKKIYFYNKKEPNQTIKIENFKNNQI